jgi:hypothetical protein
MRQMRILGLIEMIGRLLFAPLHVLVRGALMTL